MDSGPSTWLELKMHPINASRFTLVRLRFQFRVFAAGATLPELLPSNVLTTDAFQRRSLAAQERVKIVNVP